jgi:hypothetical protein
MAAAARMGPRFQSPLPGGGQDRAANQTVPSCSTALLSCHREAYRVFNTHVCVHMADVSNTR